jgi:putative membrane protein
MNRRSLFLAGAMLLPAASLMAQDRPTGVLDLLNTTSVGANRFVEQATIADSFAAQSGAMVLAKSTHPQIRQFAQDTTNAHNAMAAELRAMPEATTRLPSAGDGPMLAKLERLRGLDGDELNRWYVQMQVEAYKETVMLFDSYAQNGEVPALKAFAVKHQPAIRNFLQRAEALQAPPA